MNKVLFQGVLNIIAEINVKITGVDYSTLCKKLDYTEEQLGDYLKNPRPNASLYLEILDAIDNLLEVDINE